ncbi:MAG TPA: DUF3574 domain-containing protein [Thermomicrobiales bacterium]|jgi:hypothetical protein
MNPTNKMRNLIDLDVRGIALAIALLIGVIGISSRIVATDGTGVAAKTSAMQENDGTCDDGLPQTDEQPWIRTELFFGTSMPDGKAVTEADWKGFLDGEITPRFPDGLTVLSGFGQWQEEDQDIVQERSKLLILLYPREYAVESGTKIEAIRAAYETRFQQESVLRTDDSRPVCTSF